MVAKTDPKSEEPSPGPSQSDLKKVEEYGQKMYEESAKAVREVGAKIILSLVAAIVIWIFAELVFVPIAEDISQELLGYPIDSIVAFIVVIALAVIIFTIFVHIRRLSSALSGVLVYHFGKASGETNADSYKNYAAMLDGIMYVIVISLAYLLFRQPLSDIDPIIPAVLLVLIVLWAIITLWRSFAAISKEIGRYTSKVANELEKQAEKK